MARVLFAGIATADFVFEVEAMPRTAEKHRARAAAVIGGGCAATAAVAAARLGGEALLAARLGDDPVGDLIAAEFAREGVDASRVRRFAGAPSAFSSIFVDAQGERQIVAFRAEDMPDEAEWLSVDGPLHAVLADTRWAGGAVAAMQIARARGVPGVMDAEAPVVEPALAAASHIAFSAQGLTGWAGDASDAALLRAAEAFGGWVGVTDGAEGVRWVEDGALRRQPGFAVTTVDTLGAGDVWHGAFALALGEGMGEAASARFASAAAALKCTRPGG
ncbi:MAG: PfkB family carbohydrate kinase, partial [Pseudomonadota bacterium]